MRHILAARFLEKIGVQAADSGPFQAARILAGREDVMAISREDVEHIAYLARLGLDEDEKVRLQQQLSNILDTMRVLDRLDTQQIPPTAQVIPVRGVMRDDVVRPSWPTEQVLQNAPAREGDAILVPAVFED
jgi:aspartyl-tRNA(Asn)/glutamyl-tRNA(Gln) amidotransferase subunit C